MNDIELQSLFHTFKKSVFRLEALPQYLVDIEKPVLAAFVKGEALPPEGNDWAKLKEEWCKLISDSVSAGKTWSRVHVLPATLTPYLRFEIEWAYVFSSNAGEHLKLLLHDSPSDVRASACEDFWLFDDELVVKMFYDEDGRFLRAKKLTGTSFVSRYHQIRDSVLKHSVSLGEFLSRYRTGEIR